MVRIIFCESFLVPLCKGISNFERQTSLCRGDIAVIPNDNIATEVVHPNDQRNRFEILYRAKKDEIRGSNRRNTWSVMSAREVS